MTRFGARREVRRWRCTFAYAAGLAVFLSGASTAAAQGGDRWGHGAGRPVLHMFPSVSTGPLDPAWSPDGRWIAFSMRGDIWKVPAEGGEAVQLTEGPYYHFEPAWSPDGRWIALSYDLDANLEVGWVSADGGPVENLTNDPEVDLQPSFSRDGRFLYFTSARKGGFRIFRQDLATGEATELVTGIQPSESPDGRELAYEQRGLRVLDLATGTSRLVRDEETEYRMNPVWTPDGRSLLYVTEDFGQNDIRVIPADRGRPIELTIDREHHEMSPTPSPDGTRFAFVQFVGGVPTLYTSDIAGGRPSAWREVRITSKRTRTPTGRVRLRVLGPDGRPMPARVYLDASDGRSYSPEGSFHKAMQALDRHFFYTPGESVVEVPAGATTVEALRGWEYRPSKVSVDVPAGGEETVTLRLERLIDLPALGWYSGDTHAHDLHQGFGLTHEAFFLMLQAEDMHLTFPLIHMDGTRLMGRWEDLTGRPHPLSTPTHIMQYAQEFRGVPGHIGMIGVHEFVLPLTAGRETLNRRYIEGARAQGGLAGYMHPYGVGTLVAIDQALGLGDFYDMASLASDEVRSAEVYYHLLNAGFRLAATGGTDNFSDVFRAPPPGSAKTFARVEGPLSVDGWLDAIRRGRTFVSTGPILLMDVEGREPGDEIQLSSEAPVTLQVRADAVSITPMDSLQIIVNGEPVETVTAADPMRVTFEGSVRLPDGGWVAARVLGPTPTPAHPYLGDTYAFAHTAPVYVVRGGRRFLRAEDIRWLAEDVDRIWAAAEDSDWRTPAQREESLSAVEEARAYYRRLAEEAGGR